MSHDPVHYSIVAATAAVLAAIPAGVNTGDIARVTALGYDFTYDATSTATVDNLNVIDGPANAGRWIKRLTSTSVIFRPAGTDGPDVCTTWAGVMVAVSHSALPLTILVDVAGNGSATIVLPAGTYDMNGATILPYSGLSFFETILSLPNGVKLKNVVKMGGAMSVDCGSTTAGQPTFDWDIPPVPHFAFAKITFNCRVTVSGTESAIIVNPAIMGIIGIAFGESGFFAQTDVVATKFARVLTGGTLLLYFQGAGGGTAWFPLLTGAADATCALNVTTDGSAPFATSSATWTTFAANKITYAGRGYVLSTADRNAINILKTIGDWYMDTTANKPGFWTGAAWVDGAGVAIP